MKPALTGRPSRYRAEHAITAHRGYVLDEPEPAGFLVRIHGGHTSLEAPLNRGLVDDISTGLASGRFAVATLEAGVLYVLGVTQLSLVRLSREPARSLAVSLAQQMCALLLRGFGLPQSEAELIAAQASDEIVRRGAYATVDTQPSRPG